MKYIYYAAALFGLLFAGCSSDDEQVIESFKVLSVDRLYTELGGEGAIEVNEEGVQAESEAEWIKVSVSEKTIKLTVEKYLGLESRTASVILRKNKVEQKIAIIQEGSIDVTDITSGVHVIPAESGARVFRVKSSYPVEVSLLDGAKDWISYKVEGETITFNFSANNHLGARRGKVTIETSKWAKKEVTFRQVSLFTGTYEMAYLNHKTEERAGRCIIRKAKEEGKYILTVIPQEATDFGGLSAMSFNVAKKSEDILLLNETPIVYISGSDYYRLCALHYFVSISAFSSSYYFSIERDQNEGQDSMSLRFVPHGSLDSGKVDAIDP